jgi:hypothetical protein
MITCSKQKCKSLTDEGRQQLTDAQEFHRARMVKRADPQDRWVDSLHVRNAIRELLVARGIIDRRTSVTP